MISLMNKCLYVVMFCVPVLFLAGCSNQTRTATQQRWTSVKNATESLTTSMALISAPVKDPVKTTAQTPAKPAVQTAETTNQPRHNDPLSQGKSIQDACQQFVDSLSADTTVNVDTALNAITDKLLKSAASLLEQLKIGNDKMNQLFVLDASIKADMTPEQISQIQTQAEKLLRQAEGAQQVVKIILEQIQNHYAELEVVRKQLNAKYQFELPEIQWNNQ